MKIPKISHVRVLSDVELLVEFDNTERRSYDISHLLSKQVFAPLKDPVFFQQVKVDTGGYALVWNKDIDLSEYEVWRNGEPV